MSLELGPGKITFKRYNSFLPVALDNNLEPCLAGVPQQMAKNAVDILTDCLVGNMERRGGGYGGTRTGANTNAGTCFTAGSAGGMAFTCGTSGAGPPISKPAIYKEMAAKVISVNHVKTVFMGTGLAILLYLFHALCSRLPELLFKIPLLIGWLDKKYLFPFFAIVFFVVAFGTLLTSFSKR